MKVYALVVVWPTYNVTNHISIYDYFVVFCCCFLGRGVFSGIFFLLVHLHMFLCVIISVLMRMSPILPERIAVVPKKDTGS